jgi:hypothetical protein
MTSAAARLAQVRSSSVQIVRAVSVISTARIATTFNADDSCISRDGLEMLAAAVAILRG